MGRRLGIRVAEPFAAAPMHSKPSRPEIDHHVIKFLIGSIALFLAVITDTLTAGSIESISASYHENDAARNIFVGFLFAIAGFMTAFNGTSAVELVMSKVAALAALGVALFPCGCGTDAEVVPYVHGVSAAVMFAILAVFCALFYRRAMDKPTVQAKVRAGIYAVCFVCIVGSIVVLALDFALSGAISERFSRTTFFGENIGLVSFGTAWLVSSRALPLLTDPTERVSLSPFSK